MRRRSSGIQVDFGFKTPPRPRKPRRGRPRTNHAGVPHVRRRVDERHPLHVTLRMKRHVWQLRSRRCFTVLESAFFEGCRRFQSRLCHFSVQHNHIHLLVEAKDAVALARALQGLAIRMARGLNRVMGRNGAVFADRYHARSLRTPTEVRRAIVYVLGNARKHLPAIGRKPRADWIDPYSSAVWFPGWDQPIATGPPPARVLVAPPTTWLLTTGWLRAGGRIRSEEAPSGH
jgi:putative transposase